MLAALASCTSMSDLVFMYQFSVREVMVPWDGIWFAGSSRCIISRNPWSSTILTGIMSFSITLQMDWLFFMPAVRCSYSVQTLCWWWVGAAGTRRIQPMHSNEHCTSGRALVVSLCCIWRQNHCVFLLLTQKDPTQYSILNTCHYLSDPKMAA